MIRTDMNVRDNYLGGIDSTPATAAKQAATVAAEPAQLQQVSKPQGTPSRMGETAAATSMLKAQMLSATDSIALSNGQMHTVYPQSGANGNVHTIYINGINGDAEGTSNEAQKIANATGATVDHVFNQSTIGNVALREAFTLAARVALFGGLFGGAATLAKARTDLMQKLQNPAAATTAANDIIAQLGSPTSTNQVRLIGYSQGAAISTQATKMAYDKLKSQYGQATADKMMDRIHVLTLGGAARRTDFPQGLHLTQIFHDHDPVAQFFGDDKTSILSDIKMGKDILKPHEYYNDPMAISVINKWQQGQLDNQDVKLMDPKLRAAAISKGETVETHREFGKTASVSN